jgi:hypothetical protein
MDGRIKVGAKNPAQARAWTGHTPEFSDRDKLGQPRDRSENYLYVPVELDR